MRLVNIRFLWAGFAFLALTTLLVGGALVAPSWLIAEKGLSVNQRLQREADLRGSLLQALAGLVLVSGAIFAAWNTLLNRDSNRLVERGQVTDRFGQAVNQLGSEAIEVRVGAMYAFERLAVESSSQEAQSIINIMCAFLRSHCEDSGRSVSYLSGDRFTREISEDSRAALEVLSRIHETMGLPIVLEGLDFPDACDLSALNLSGMDLRFSNFNGASLMGADMRGTNLSYSNLSDTYLTVADLRDADLQEANLERSVLFDTRLAGADLRDTNLKDAGIAETDFSKTTHLTKEQISGARIDELSILPWSSGNARKRGIT
jgi:uncharacterized protein YjbI with pentapeptide repeats